ncbi:MAG: hypothetical protein IJH84_20675, partial [Saccharopolyspora sp.]|uniref:hypothetical protein n=1 Tax=Saccharopolyspora sp. TaxID=33915 RepID=UPI0025CF719B
MSRAAELYGVPEGVKPGVAAAHFADGRFVVRAKSGQLHSLDHEQMAGLLLSAGRLGGAWSQQRSLLWLSCNLGDPVNSAVSQGLRDLLSAHVGEQRASVGRPELFERGGVKLHGDAGISRLGDGEVHRADPAELGSQEGNRVRLTDEPETQPTRRAQEVGEAAVRMLRDVEDSVRPNRTEPAPLLGEDYFGLLSPAPRPEWLSDVDHTRLTTAELGSLLEAADLTHDAPASLSRADLTSTPEQVLSVHRPEQTRSDWAPGEVERLPADLEMPALLHTVWLGGPVVPSGGTEPVWHNFGDAASKYTGGTSVLWTDVPRADFQAARENPAPTDGSPDPHAAVRQMSDWAQRNNVRLVNIHEMFHADSPMRLAARFNSQSAQLSGRGWAGASDIARLEILRAFGGTYTDGDNTVRDPDQAQAVVRTQEAWALPTISKKLIGNSAFAMPRQHPVADFLLAHMEQKFATTQRERFGEAVDLPNQAFDAPKMRSRRYSLMQRGPDLLHDVAAALGYQEATDLPTVPAVHPGSAGSWLDEPAEQQGPSSDQVGKPAPIRDPAGSADLTRKVIQTLVRDLHNREGDLHRTAVGPALARHADPDAVCTAALRFIANRPELAGMVRSITDRYWADGKFHDTPLPEAARDLFVVAPTGHRDMLAETVKPAAVRTPATSLDLGPGAGELPAGVRSEVDWMAAVAGALGLEHESGPGPSVEVRGDEAAAQQVASELRGRLAQHAPGPLRPDVVVVPESGRTTVDLAVKPLDQNWQAKVDAARDMPVEAPESRPGTPEDPVPHDSFADQNEGRNEESDSDSDGGFFAMPIRGSGGEQAARRDSVDSDGDSDGGFFAMPIRGSGGEQAARRDPVDSDGDSDGGFFAVQPNRSVEMGPDSADAPESIVPLGRGRSLTAEQ